MSLAYPENLHAVEVTRAAVEAFFQTFFWLYCHDRGSIAQRSTSVAPMSRYIICICRYNSISTVSESVKTISVLPIREITYVRERSRINAARATTDKRATIAVACCKRRSAKQCHVEKKIANMELLYCRRQRSPSNLQYLQRYRTQRRSICEVFYYNQSSGASSQTSNGV